jgi:hypothetical protein
MENDSGSECYTFEDVRKMLVLSPSRCNDLFNKRTKGSQDFPAFKVGRTWRVRKEAYDSWIEQQEKKPIPKKMVRKKKEI